MRDTPTNREIISLSVEFMQHALLHWEHIVQGQNYYSTLSKEDQSNVSGMQVAIEFNNDMAGENDDPPIMDYRDSNWAPLNRVFPFMFDKSTQPGEKLVRAAEAIARMVENHPDGIRLKQLMQVEFASEEAIQALKDEHNAPAFSDFCKQSGPIPN